MVNYLIPLFILLLCYRSYYKPFFIDEIVLRRFCYPKPPTEQSLDQPDIVRAGVAVSRLFKCLQDLILVIAYSPPPPLCDFHGVAVMV
jgi:hypothetical protein